MAEKELEPPQKVKPPTFQPPNLLTSKASEPTSTHRNGDHHDHYQSVSQKAKLILPTALWILIVVAGLCFLSLLSSLNKSINTLDTLVELEQANAKHQHHSAGAQAHHSEPLKTIAEHEQEEEERAKSSWLSLPNWTSLEPAAHHKRNNNNNNSGAAKRPHPDEPDEQGLLDSKVVNEMIDELLKDSPASQGEIIIEASSSLPLQQRDKKVADSELASIIGGFDSILKQFMGPFVGEPKGDDRNGAKEDQQATVMANIDTINIHLSGDDDRHHKSGDGRRPEVDDLETTMEKLLDEINADQRNQEKPLDLPETILIPLGETRPQPHRPLHRHRHGHQHQQQAHHHHHHQAPIPVAILDDVPSSSSALSNLLLPPGLRPISHSGLGPLDSLLPSNAMNSLASGPEFIIQLGGPMDEPKAPTKSSGKIPYDILSTGPFDQFMTSQKPVDFGSSLASSLLRQTLFPVQESSTTTTKKETTRPFVIGDLDLSPNSLLEQSPKGDESSSLSMKNNNNDGQPTLHDIFSLFFGPPPNSSLVVAPQVVEPKISTLEPASEDEATAAAAAATASSPRPEPSKAKTDIPELLTALNKELIEPAKPSTEASMPSEMASEAASSPAPVATSKQESSQSDPLLEDFLGSMFSLPQLSGQSGPLRTESQQFGTGSSTSSSSSNNNNNNNNNNNGGINNRVTTHAPEVSQRIDTNKTTHATELSSLEKVIEVVEPVKDKARNDLLKDLPADLLAPLRPTTEPMVITNKEPSSSAPQSTTFRLSTTSPEAKRTTLDSPVEVVVFEENKSSSDPHTTSPAAVSVSQPILISPTTAAPEKTSSPPTEPAPHTTTVAPEKPFKAFLKKADDFIERNLVNFKKLLA